VSLISWDRFEATLADRIPEGDPGRISGYTPTREAAMAASAKSWRFDVISIAMRADTQTHILSGQCSNHH